MACDGKTKSECDDSFACSWNSDKKECGFNKWLLLLLAVPLLFLMGGKTSSAVPPVPPCTTTTLKVNVAQPKAAVIYLYKKIGGVCSFISKKKVFNGQTIDLTCNNPGDVFCGPSSYYYVACSTGFYPQEGDVEIKCGENVINISLLSCPVGSLDPNCSEVSCLPKNC